MKKLGILGLLVVALVFVIPLPTNAKKPTPPAPAPAPPPPPAPTPTPPQAPAPSPTLTVTPLTIAPGGVMTISVTIPEGGRISKFYWFTKDSSEAAIASWAFGCYTHCFYSTTSKYTIPTSWADGSNYYVKIYDHANDEYIKANFTVKR
jgi:hypothetical protein